MRRIEAYIAERDLNSKCYAWRAEGAEIFEKISAHKRSPSTLDFLLNLLPARCRARARGRGRPDQEREIAGLLEAMRCSKGRLSKAIILTRNQSDQFLVDGQSIHLVPAWEWL